MADASTPEQGFVKVMTAKEIKNLAKPEFAANPDKFYPTKTLAKLGFSRSQCPVCKNNFWRASAKRETCGDSQCAGAYSFIGVGTGIGKKGKKITYAQAWEGFCKSLSSARIPCTPIKRYPVVARWRADVEFVAAGIFCFQPYCVTGELDPPANPLICPQFCLRFNDLDNIGLTGRHYSGFVMLGIQVFNKPNDFKFWSDECVEFNLRWLTEELGIDKEEITLIEDVWAGGGNLGPSIEYFVNGLELGNMVFMQFKTFPDGHREELQVKVIDVGIGLERVPWLINGSATSYMDVFPSALKFLLDKVDVKVENDIWTKFGPYSALLNVDEVQNIDLVWADIAKKINVDVKVLKKAIEPIRDAYVICDHTRTALMAIMDGSLPSNVGGAANVRNILRRVFAVLERNGWSEKVGMEGLLTLFDKHKEDLSCLYGAFPPYKSFEPIIKLEYQRWKNSDEEQKKKLDKLLAKKKGQPLTVDDWILCLSTFGLPADTVAKLSGQDPPGNLYAELAERQERMQKVLPTQLYSTASMKPTESLYYADHHMYEFKAKITETPPNVENKMAHDIVVTDVSAFYPTSGGQEHDTGKMTIQGKKYDVVNVEKIGPCVFHYLDRPLEGWSDAKPDQFKGVTVTATVDEARRDQLRKNHTATHIVFAACRRVLGPHVWQHGAKKELQQAHLDITHFESLSFEDLMAIQKEANRIVASRKDIHKSWMPKDEAEKQYGFTLYQGGVVPGNELRVVNIADTDTEACCGTHADNTAEVGFIKMIKTLRLSDGIVRLYYVAGDFGFDILRKKEDILQELVARYQVPEEAIVSTVSKFFDGYRKDPERIKELTLENLELRMERLVDSSDTSVLFKSDEPEATLYIGNVPNYAQELKTKGKNIVFIGETFLYGFLGKPSAFDTKLLQAVLDTSYDEEVKKAGQQKAPKKPTVVSKTSVGKKTKVDGIVELTVFSMPPSAQQRLAELFLSHGFASKQFSVAAAPAAAAPAAGKSDAKAATPAPAAAKPETKAAPAAEPAAKGKDQGKKGKQEAKAEAKH